MNWISVENQLPELREMYPDGPRQSAKVLIWVDNRTVSIGRLEETYRKRVLVWRDRGKNNTNCEPSHWAPLPEGPKNTDENSTN